MSSRNDQGAHFEEAIAHHQLELQTELKKATSLPSATFDAGDPMLEARLCAATERIIRSMLEIERDDAGQAADPGRDAAAAGAAGAAGAASAADAPDAAPEPRLEAVSAAEVAALLRAVSADRDAVEPPPFDEGAQAEFTAVLADLCGRGGPAAGHAARLLRAAAAGDGGGDPLEQLLAELGRDVARDDPRGLDADRIAAVCDRIARAVLGGVYGDADHGAEERRPS